MISLLLAATLCHAAPAWQGTAKLSSYCSRCNTPPGSNAGRYGPLVKGDIAADPRYWKAGTRILIEGIGVCRVRDTGGNIKGKGRFDVYLGWKTKCPCNGWRLSGRRLRYRRVSP